jgi:hypothetical protein
MDEEELSPQQPQQLTPQAMNAAVRGPAAADTTQMSPEEIAVRNQFAQFGEPQVEQGPTVGFMRTIDQINQHMLEGRKDAMDLSEPGTNNDGIPGTATFSHLKNRFIAKDKTPVEALEYLRQKFPERSFFATYGNVYETVGEGQDVTTVPLDPANSSWGEVGQEIVADNPRIVADVAIQTGLAATTSGMSIPARMAASGVATGAREAVVQGTKKFWGDSVTLEEAAAATIYEGALGAAMPGLEAVARGAIAKALPAQMPRRLLRGANRLAEAASPGYNAVKGAMGQAKDATVNAPIEGRHWARFLGFRPDEFKRTSAKGWGPMVEKDPTGDFRRLVAANLQPGAEGIGSRLQAAGMFDTPGVNTLDDWVSHAAIRADELGESIGSALNEAQKIDLQMVEAGSLEPLTRRDVLSRTMTDRLRGDISGSESNVVGRILDEERENLVRRGLGGTGNQQLDAGNEKLTAYMQAKKELGTLENKLLSEERLHRARMKQAAMNGADADELEAMAEGWEQKKALFDFRIQDAHGTMSKLEGEALGESLDIKRLDGLIQSLDDDAFAAGEALDAKKAEVLRNWSNELRTLRDTRMQKILPEQADNFKNNAALYGDIRDALRAAEAKRAILQAFPRKVYLSSAFASGERRTFRLTEHLVLSDAGIKARYHWQRGEYRQAKDAIYHGSPWLLRAIGKPINKGVDAILDLEILDSMKKHMDFQGLGQHPTLKAAFEGTRRAAEMEVTRHWTPELQTFLEEAAAYSKSEMNSYLKGEPQGEWGGLPRNLQGVLQGQMVVPLMLQQNLPQGVGDLISSQASQLMGQAHTAEGKRQLGEFFGMIEKTFPGIIPWESGRFTGLASEFDFGDGPKLYLDDDLASWHRTIEASALNNMEKARRITSLNRDKTVIPLDVELDSKLLQLGNAQAKEVVGNVTIDRNGLVESMQTERNSYGKRLSPQ